jgi:hypothetical protein
MKDDEPLKRPPAAELTTELLILPDGRILVHNLTRPFAELLQELNPAAEQIASRVTHHSPPSRESGGADLPVSPRRSSAALPGSMHHTGIIETSHELPD